MSAAENLPEEVKLSDISEIGQLVPKGRYKCRLSMVTGKLSKNEAPMVEAVFDVLDGEHEGMTVSIYHSLKVSKGQVKSGPNKGKPQFWAPGITDMKAAMKAVGQPVPEATTFKTNPTVEDAQKWAQVYGKILGPQLGAIEIAVLEEPRRVKNAEGKYVNEVDEQGKTRMTTRAKVVGRWRDGAAPTAGAKNPLEGIGGLG